MSSLSSIELITKQKQQTFHLGLTMAGAVSAGAYTGGVMDYLMQTLDRWQKAKDQNDGIWQRLDLDGNLTETGLAENGYDFRIPMHNVVIEAIGGASAGGMTSTMCMMAAVDKNYTPVETLEQTNDPQCTQHNIFYESWVRLLETEKEKAMDLMLQHTDLIGKGIYSILNVDIIDKLSEQAFKNIDKLESANLKPYISPKVELLLTLTSLRGIQISVDFSASEALQSVALNTKLRHNMYTHGLVAHFAIDFDKLGREEKWNYLDMRSPLLKECSIATGAFPFGLKSRRIKGISYYYIHAALKRSLTYEVNLNDFDPENDFEFIAVDGGTMNNEPYAEVYDVLEKCAQPTRDASGAEGCVCHGLIMIDPFPNYADVDRYEYKDKVTELPGELYNSLRQQAMVKDSSVFSKSYSRWLVVPIKWKQKGEQYMYPLCCASLGAFGGFFDEEFRKHDFFLGRNNCQNFIQRYFTIKWNPETAANEPIHKYWTDDMRKTFKTVDAKTGDVYLQIIPDLSLLAGDGRRNPFDYTYKPYPQYNIDRLLALTPKLEVRIRLLLKELSLFTKKDPVNNPVLTQQQIQDKAELAEILNGVFPKSWFGKLFSKVKFTGVYSLAYLFGTGIVARKLAKMAVENIITDFHTQGLLGNADNRTIKK